MEVYKSVATMAQMCGSTMDSKNMCGNDMQAAAGSIKSIGYGSGRVETRRVGAKRIGVNGSGTIGRRCEDVRSSNLKEPLAVQPVQLLEVFKVCL